MSKRNGYPDTQVRTSKFSGRAPDTGASDFLGSAPPVEGGYRRDTGIFFPGHQVEAVESREFNGAELIVNPRPNRWDTFPIPQVMTEASVISSAWKTYLHRWDEAMQKSREDALAMRRDSFLMSLLQERILAFSSRKWHLEPDNDKDPVEKAVADGVTKIINSISHLEQLRYYLGERLWYGRYGAQLRLGWKEMDLPAPRVSVGGGAAGFKSGGKTERRRALCVIPGYPDFDDPGHLPINGDKIGHAWDHSAYLMVNAAWEDQLPRVPPAPPPIWSTYAKAQPLKGMLRKQFIIAKHLVNDADFFEAEMAEGIGGVGLRTVLYFMWFLRSEWLSNISDVLQQQGMGGIRIWYYQAGNNASRAEVKAAAENNLNRFNILVPRFAGERGQGTEQVEVKDAPTAGLEYMRTMIDWIDGCQERFIVGQSMSGGADNESGLGGSGRAKFARDTKYQITLFDAANEGAHLTTDLVHVIQEYTYPDYKDMPLRWRTDVDEPNIKEWIEGVKTYVDMGGEIADSRVAERLGAPIPEEGEKVLSKLQQQKQQLSLETEAAKVTQGMEQEVADREHQRALQLEGQRQGHQRALHEAGLRAQQEAADREEGEATQFARDRQAYLDALATAAKDVGRPTEAQKRSGNYAKGHMTIQGLPITIENPAGSTRTGKTRDGKGWSVEMAHHYGYIKRTQSEADGDHVDVFIGPHPESELVFVIDQNKPDGGFDEHKCMLGFTNATEAKQGYLDSYSTGWKGFAGIRPMTMEDFKAWLETGTGEPASGHFERDRRTSQFAAGDWSERDHPRGQPENAGQFVGETDTRSKDKDAGKGPADDDFAEWERERAGLTSERPDSERWNSPRRKEAENAVIAVMEANGEKPDVLFATKFGHTEFRHDGAISLTTDVENDGSIVLDNLTSRSKKLKPDASAEEVSYWAAKLMGLKAGRKHMEFARLDAPSASPLTGFQLAQLIERLRRLGPPTSASNAAVARELAEILRRFPDLRRHVTARDLAWLQMAG